ncbi:Regulation of nuclear pre-mRNA domain-containing protein 2 [Trichinella pseudospiralis]|uniref:Regulation of nuclear pre-mRNA domain-containing protein 2 n=1 Tax=Trichinella pseudospiralis TaxID=6337 RepID=A0A0V1JXI2_TRIPS|nr:Regulation of nuclear pre-mRNA domain-containing protein 2 [Trichinella pseudospiralis]KRZ39689.1 Regulation of nuclear pre-mRNA domain-containing protein 2 [Trichinella pseudospiralis]
MVILEDDVLDQFLNNLSTSQDSITGLSKWCLERSSYHSVIIRAWHTFFYSATSNKRLACLFLLNDICQRERARNQTVFREEFATHLHGVFMNACTGELRSQALRLLKLWDERKIFNNNVLDVIRDIVVATGSKSNNVENYNEACLRVTRNFDKLSKNGKTTFLKATALWSHRERSKTHIAKAMELRDSFYKYMADWKSHLVNMNKLLCRAQVAKVFYGRQNEEVEIVSQSYRVYENNLESVVQEMKDMQSVGNCSRYQNPSSNSASSNISQSEFNIPLARQLEMIISAAKRGKVDESRTAEFDLDDESNDVDECYILKVVSIYFFLQDVRQSNAFVVFSLAQLSSKSEKHGIQDDSDVPDKIAKTASPSNSPDRSILNSPSPPPLESFRHLWADFIPTEEVRTDIPTSSAAFVVSDIPSVSSQTAQSFRYPPQVVPTRVYYRPEPGAALRMRVPMNFTFQGHGFADRQVIMGNHRQRFPNFADYSNYIDEHFSYCIVKDHNDMPGKVSAVAGNESATRTSVEAWSAQESSSAEDMNEQEKTLSNTVNLPNTEMTLPRNTPTNAVRMLPSSGAVPHHLHGDHMHSSARYFPPLTQADVGIWLRGSPIATAHRMVHSRPPPLFHSSTSLDGKQQAVSSDTTATINQPPGVRPSANRPLLGPTPTLSPNRYYRSQAYNTAVCGYPASRQRWR